MNSLWDKQTSFHQLGLFPRAIDELFVLFFIHFVPPSLIVFIDLLAISHPHLSLCHVYLLDTIYWGGLLSRCTVFQHCLL